MYHYCIIYFTSCSSPVLFIVNSKYLYVFREKAVAPIVRSVRGVTPFSQLSQMLCLVSPLGLH